MAALTVGDYEIVELKVLRGMKELRATLTLGFGRADCWLFGELSERILHETVLKSKGAQENWQVVKDNLLQLHEPFTLILRKLGRCYRISARLNREIVIELQYKKEIYRKRKQEQAWKYEFRNATCVCRNGGRKAKAHLELMLVRNLNGNKNLHCCVISKTLNKKKVGIG